MDRCLIGRCAVFLLLSTMWLYPSMVFGTTLSDRVISGQVVDTDGKPVPNAEVYCSPYMHNRFQTVTARSSADGDFAMSIPPVSEFKSDPDRLWAFAPGYSVAVDFVPNSKREQSSLRLVLGPPSKLRVRVNLPDGKPAQGAKVLVPVLRMKTKRGFARIGEKCFPPDTLVASTAVTTDKQGIALVTAWRHQDTERVDIVLPSFGRQMCYSGYYLGRRPDTWTIKLMPAGQLHGRVIADGPYPVNGLKIYVRAMSTAKDHRYGIVQFTNRPPAPMFIDSQATVETDSEGRFEVPEMAGKWITVEIINGLNKPYQYRPAEPSEFHPGNSKELVIPLRKAVKVHGTMRLIGSDARPSQFMLAASKSVTSSKRVYRDVNFYADIDDKGRFEFYSLPGTCGLWILERKESRLSDSPGWVHETPGNGWNLYWLSGRSWICIDPPKDPPFGYLYPWIFTIPNDVEDFEFPSLELCRVRGRVVNSEGKPIPNVTVYTGGKKKLITDEQGLYQLWRKAESKSDFVFNMAHWRLMMGDDNMLRSVRYSDSAPEYEEKTIRWDIRNFPDGKIPDVVLQRLAEEKPPAAQQVKDAK